MNYIFQVLLFREIFTHVIMVTDGFTVVCLVVGLDTCPISLSMQNQNGGLVPGATLCPVSYYRPHPKDGEGTVFTVVSLSTPKGGGGGCHSPRFFPRSLVPVPFWGYLSPRYFPRSLVPGPFWGRGVPHS